MPYLNVGCGNTRIKDHINMDITDNEQTDVDIIASILKIPYDDDYFDGLVVSHVFEHLSYMEHQNAMQECWRVLKVGGKIKISCPDLTVTIQNFLENKNGLNSYWYQAIFGGRRYPGDEHNSGFTKVMMADLLFVNSFGDVTFHDGYPWNINLTATKIKRIQQFKELCHGDNGRNTNNSQGETG